MKKDLSHPHPLKLSLPSQQDDHANVVCSACEQALNPADPVYSCCERGCDFFLHKSCSELPSHIGHKSHRPDHALTLLYEPPEYSLYYDCSACGGLINGFSFHCDKCEDSSFRVHVKCAFLAETVDSKAHEHTLSVEYSSTENSETSTRSGDNVFACDICDHCLTEGYWFYYCKECDFRTHLECAISAEGPPEKVEEEEEEEGLSDEQRLMMAKIKMEGQMARLEFQMQMAKLNAQTISNLCNFY